MLFSFHLFILEFRIKIIFFIKEFFKLMYDIIIPDYSINLVI